MRETREPMMLLNRVLTSEGSNVSYCGGRDRLVAAMVSKSLSVRNGVVTGCVGDDGGNACESNGAVT